MLPSRNTEKTPFQGLLCIFKDITLQVAELYRMRLAADIQIDLTNRACSHSNLICRTIGGIQFITWREASNVVFFFFIVLNIYQPSSWLMCIIHPAARREDRFQHVSTRISVTSTSHLPPLFDNAKQVLGLPSLETLSKRKYGPNPPRPR